MNNSKASRKVLKGYPTVLATHPPVGGEGTLRSCSPALWQFCSCWDSGLWLIHWQRGIRSGPLLEAMVKGTSCFQIIVCSRLLIYSFFKFLTHFLFSHYMSYWTPSTSSWFILLIKYQKICKKWCKTLNTHKLAIKFPLLKYIFDYFDKIIKKSLSYGS